MELKIKRIYAEADATDGVRLLVDRVWPRGISKEQAHIVRWCKEVAPSTALRKWFAHDAAKWEAMCERYKAELDDNPLADDWANCCRTLLAESNVTLVYGAKDEVHNQAVILADWLRAKLQQS